MKRLIIISALLLAVVFTVSADRRRLLMVKNFSGASVSPPTYILHSTNSFTADTTVALDIPSGTTTGDMLVLAFELSATQVITFPSGFTLQESNSLGAGGFQIATKIADGSEGASLSTTMAVSATGSGMLITVRGASAVDTDAVETGAPGAGVAHTTASVTPSVNNCLLLGFIGIDVVAGVPTFTEVSGFPLTGFCNNDSNGSLGFARRTQTTATAEGVQIIENLGGTWMEYTLVFKP